MIWKKVSYDLRTSYSSLRRYLLTFLCIHTLYVITAFRMKKEKKIVRKQRYKVTLSRSDLLYRCMTALTRSTRLQFLLVMLYLTNPYFGPPTEHSAIAPQWPTVYRILLLHARSFDNDAPIGKWKRRGGVYLNLALPFLKVSHQWLSSEDSVITVNDANFPLSRDPVTSSLSYKLSTGEDQFASSAFLLVRSCTHEVETLTTSFTCYFRPATKQNFAVLSPTSSPRYIDLSKANKGERFYLVSFISFLLFPGLCFGTLTFTLRCGIRIFPKIKLFYIILYKYMCGYLYEIVKNFALQDFQFESLRISSVTILFLFLTSQLSTSDYKCL